MSALHYFDEPLRITFGDRVRRIRLRVGMNQEEFAEALAYSHATVSRWEKADHDPRSTKRIINAVQLAFGPEAAEFLRAGRESTDSSPTLRVARFGHVHPHVAASRRVGHLFSVKLAAV